MHGRLPKAFVDWRNDLILSWGCHHPSVHKKRIWKLPVVGEPSDGHLLVCFSKVLTVKPDCIHGSYFTGKISITSLPENQMLLYMLEKQHNLRAPQSRARQSDSYTVFKREADICCTHVPNVDPGPGWILRGARSGKKIFIFTLCRELDLWSSFVAQLVKDPELPQLRHSLQLQCGLNPLPGTFHLPWVWPNSPRPPQIYICRVEIGNMYQRNKRQCSVEVVCFESSLHHLLSLFSAYFLILKVSYKYYCFSSKTGISKPFWKGLDCKYFRLRGPCNLCCNFSAIVVRKHLYPTLSGQSCVPIKLSL